MKLICLQPTYFLAIGELMQLIDFNNTINILAYKSILMTTCRIDIDNKISEIVGICCLKILGQCEMKQFSNILSIK